MARTIALLVIAVVLLLIFQESKVIGWGIRIGGLYAMLAVLCDVAAWLIGGARKDPAP